MKSVWLVYWEDARDGEHTVIRVCAKEQDAQAYALERNSMSLAKHEKDFYWVNEMTITY